MTVTHLRSTSGLVLVFPGTELVTRALVRMRSGRRAARTGLVSDESTTEEEEEEDSGAVMCVMCLSFIDVVIGIASPSTLLSRVSCR